MGIPKLNSYLLNNCSKHSIDQKHLSVCTGKTIVIDTSIYLYKFASMGSIIEPLYHMICIFNYYNIMSSTISSSDINNEPEYLVLSSLKSLYFKRSVDLILHL